MQIQMSLGPLSLVFTYPDNLDPLCVVEGFRLMAQTKENEALRGEWLAAHGYLGDEGNQLTSQAKHL